MFLLFLACSYFVYFFRLLKNSPLFPAFSFLSPNFYILDEPTNHLDMETIEALAKALNKFKVSTKSLLY